ncbi:MAG: hypothetical protein PHI06_15090 [Desulfobulbaceae bacterium]|nr:hypothetical protein [Desulfobulbaceae bacterium]
MDANAFLEPAYDTPSFNRIVVPANAQIGEPASVVLAATTRSVPVFSSLAPATISPSATDTVKVKSGTARIIQNFTALHITEDT